MRAIEAQGEHPQQGGTPERLFFLDWLRIIAFLILVLYHVGMYYVTWDFHVKSPHASHALEPWMKLSEPWRMSLLFMVSGAATAFMLKRGATGALLRWRTRHLLLPLLCGVVLIVPPQSYFQVVQKWQYSGGYLDFLKLYFQHYKGFCQNGNCLILPTWNHLWFLPYLWVYTLLLWLAVRLWPQALTALALLMRNMLSNAGLMLVPIGWIFALRITLFARYPETHALWGDWFSHAVYFGMFLTGASFTTEPQFWDRLESWRWPALLSAIIFWAILVGIRPGGVMEHAVVATFQWCALVAAFGFARRLLNQDHPARRDLTQAVFPVYLFHQTIIIVASQWMQPLQWPPTTEGPALVLLTLGLSYAGYRGVRRVPMLRPWFGLRPLP